MNQFIQIFAGWSIERIYFGDTGYYLVRVVNTVKVA
jgi:hypothetical protein